MDPQLPLEKYGAQLRRGLSVLIYSTSEASKEYPPPAVFRRAVGRLVLRGRHARVALEVAPEKRLVGEVERIGDFLDAQARIFEQRFGFEDDIDFYPLRNRLAADALDERG